MFLTRRSYDAACAAAFEKGREAGERLLAVMREQHSTLLKQLEASLERERQHSLDLATIRAATPFVPVPQHAEQPRPRNPDVALRKSWESQDPWRELPLGDAQGTFESAADAAILPADLSSVLTAALAGEPEVPNGG